MNKIEIKNLSPKNIILKVKNSKKRMSKKRWLCYL